MGTDPGHPNYGITEDRLANQRRYSRRTIRLDLVRGLRPVIVQHGIADEAELDELDRVLRDHLADPDTLVMPFLYFMTWGRKPGRQPET
ncbi:MAG TPA: hypothetical protein VF060_15565 [Trebonia sp.]